MILAYLIAAQDDDSFMLGPDTYKAPPGTDFYDWRFGKEGIPHPATCPTCGRKTDPGYINPAFRVTHRSWDLAPTYDGYLLVSSRFRSFCEENLAETVGFLPLPSDADFSVLQVDSRLAFDASRRGTRFEQPCPACKMYFSVIGATPVFLHEVSEPIRSGIYRTDLEFGCGHEQGPLFLVGVDTAARLRQRRFRNCELLPVRL